MYRYIKCTLEYSQFVEHRIYSKCVAKVYRDIRHLQTSDIQANSAYFVKELPGFFNYISGDKICTHARIEAPFYNINSGYVSVYGVLESGPTDSKDSQGNIIYKLQFKLVTLDGSITEEQYKLLIHLWGIDGSSGRYTYYGRPILENRSETRISS